jgi:hypothetical protein
MPGGKIRRLFIFFIWFVWLMNLYFPVAFTCDLQVTCGDAPPFLAEKTAQPHGLTEIIHP